MATPRTAEEKLAIVEHCMDLERAGGDILGYLWSENYITPRATWCNIQREYLHRKPYEYTDGKPKIIKGVNNMKNVHLTEDQRMEACTLAIEGKDPKAYLEGLGCPNPDQSWGSCKGWFKQHYPEQFDKIPARINKPKEQKVKPPVVKIDGPIRIETPEANKVEIVEKPERQIGGLCPPPEVEDDRLFHTAAVRNKKLGTFYYDDKHGTIDWRHPSGEEISLFPEDYRLLRDSINMILNVLGVKV